MTDSETEHLARIAQETPLVFKAWMEEWEEI